MLTLDGYPSGVVPALLACTFAEPAPDVVYGGGRIEGELTLDVEDDEGPIGTFSIEGTDDPASFDFENCVEGGALSLGNDVLHQRVVACGTLEDVELKEVWGWCGTRDYGTFRLDLPFDKDGTRIWTTDAVMSFDGEPGGSLDAWSMSALTMNDVETHGMSIHMERVDWVIMAAEPDDCQEHLGILGRGQATISWSFDPDVRAVMD